MTHATEPLVLAEDLTVTYNAVRAVDGLTFHVNGGESVGLLGGNGAGKSSTLRAMAGINPPNSGLLKVAGYDLSRPADAEAARRLVGYCPDVGGLIRQATVREHIGLALASRGRLNEWPAAMHLLDAFDLMGVLDRETHGFSHGMSRRLSVLLAAVTAERVLILDEPFDGVDPLGVHATEAVISQAKENGLAVIVSTHLLNLLTGVTDRMVVMVKGKAVETGPSFTFRGDQGAAHYEGLLRNAVTVTPQAAPIPAPVAG